MKLIKWYYDLVTKDGDAYIGYAVHLQILGLTLPWRSNYIWHKDQEIFQQGIGGFTQGGDEDFDHFSIPAFSLFGQWEKNLSSPNLQVMDLPYLSINWQAVSMQTAGKIRCNDIEMTGLGYCEKLELNFSKIKLPIQQLYWGRFIADNQQKSLIWIGIKNAHDFTMFILENGQLNATGEISEYDIKTDNAHLHLHDSKTLIKTNIAQHIPCFLQKLFGQNIMNGQEQKWRSKGILKDSHGIEHYGWAIHEVVTW